MGLYHSVDLVYGFEIPTETDFGAIENALSDQPNPTERINYLVIGDYDRLILTAHIVKADENTVIAITPDLFARYEIPAWDQALHGAATRIDCPDHPQPGWLLIHNYR